MTLHQTHPAPIPVAPAKPQVMRGDTNQNPAGLGLWMLLREDRDFHTIQMVEAACRQVGQVEEPAARTHFLVAASRYLAAHAPTLRAQGQTYQIAQRLHQGDRLFEED